MDWFSPFIENFEEEFNADECASHMVPGQPKYDSSEKYYDYMYMKDKCRFIYDCMGPGNYLEEHWYESMGVVIQRCMDDPMGGNACMESCDWYWRRCDFLEKGTRGC